MTGRPPYEAATTPEVAKLVLAGKAVRPSATVPARSLACFGVGPEYDRIQHS